MNIAEILRGLADKIEGASGEGRQSAELQPAQASNDESPEVNTQPMVSPLQLQAEILKKVAGEDEECPQCGQSPCKCENEINNQGEALMILRRNAGI